MDTIRITIPGEPRTKKNSQQILINKATGRPFIMPSKEYKAYSKHCAIFMPKLKEPIAEPVNVKAVYYRSTRRRVDLVNLLEATADILVENKVLADDNRNVVYAMDGSRVYHNKEHPRTEITIEPIENEDVERWTNE